MIYRTLLSYGAKASLFASGLFVGYTRSDFIDTVVDTAIHQNADIQTIASNDAVHNALWLLKAVYHEK